jgi:hypothetical protein
VSETCPTCGAPYSTGGPFGKRYYVSYLGTEALREQNAGLMAKTQTMGQRIAQLTNALIVVTCTRCHGRGRLARYGGDGFDYDELNYLECPDCSSSRRALGQTLERTPYDRGGEWVGPDPRSVLEGT